MPTKIGPLQWLLAALAAAWTGFPVAVHLLLIMMVIDFVTGVFCAIRRREVNSQVSWLGLMRKCAVGIVVGTVYLLQHAIQQLAGISLVVDLAQTIALAYVWNELISIVENCSCMGAPIPDSLARLLANAPRMGPRSPAQLRVARRGEEKE